MKASFNISLVEGENCTILKNSICDNNFLLVIIMCFHAQPKAPWAMNLEVAFLKVLYIGIYIYSKKCAWERIRGRREKKL
jgi:hypothetical protein